MIDEKQKPYRTTQFEQDLRWDLFFGKITQITFNLEYDKLLKAGKIIRSGKVVRE